MTDYAKIFIDRPDGSFGLIFEVQQAVAAPRSSVVIQGTDVEVELRRNPEAGQAPGFLGFPIVAEIEGRAGVSMDAVVAAVAALTARLDVTGYHFVTSADFEDRLPGQGRNVEL